MKAFGVTLMFALIFFLPLRSPNHHAQSLQSIVNGNSTAPPPACSGITGTYTDCFTSAGVLTTPWTNSAGAGFTSATLTATGSSVIPTTVSQVGAAAYTGGTFSAAQSARTIFTSALASANSQATGPCVRFDVTTGNGYCWLLGIGSVYVVTAGGGGSTPVTGCPAVTSGTETDVYELSVDSGFNFTCKDVTTSAQATGSDGGSTYATGKAGLVIDQRNSAIVALAKWGGS